jgi:broad specificity phosphatase PhoE
MPKKIILIRHGETDYNREKRWQGWIDIPLNRQGIRQARNLAKRLKSELVDAFYTSDLKRSVHTADLIAEELGIKLVKSEKLRERYLGIFEGLTYDESETRYKKLLEKLFDFEDEDFSGHEGETHKQVKQRLKSFVDFLQSWHANQTVMIVTHGGSTYYLLQFLTEEPLGEVRFGNTAITVLKKSVQGGYRIVTLSDISHLEEK